MHTISVGADPEFFVKNTQLKVHLSAHEFLPGTKENPSPIRDGAVQVDGTAAEINIKPARKPEAFYQYLRTSMRSVNKMLKKKNNKLVLDIAASLKYDKSYYDNLPLKCKMIGCDPFWNAYEMCQKQPFALEEGLVAAGGHLHIGWIEKEEDFHSAPYMDFHIFDCVDFTKQLDYSIYFLSYFWDFDYRRRASYGQKGLFRPKPYGCEYRSLSNQWCFHKDLVNWIFKATQHSYNLLADKILLFDSQSNSMFTLIDTVSTCTLETEELYSRLITYHDYLVDLYRYPALPSRYLDQAKFIEHANRGVYSE